MALTNLVANDVVVTVFYGHFIVSGDDELKIRCSHVFPE